MTTIKSADKKMWWRRKRKRGNTQQGESEHGTEKRGREKRGREGERRRGKVSGAGPAFFPLISSTPLITMTEGGQEREKVSRETVKFGLMEGARKGKREGWKGGRRNGGRPKRESRSIETFGKEDKEEGAKNRSETSDLEH